MLNHAKLTCTPGHKRIKGNEQADELANEVINEFQVNTIHQILYTNYRVQLYEEWQRHSDNFCREKATFCYIIAPMVKKKPCFHKFQLSQSFVITLCRIRLNHNLVLAHLYKIKIKDSPNCDCNEVGL